MSKITVHMVYECPQKLFSTVYNLKYSKRLYNIFRFNFTKECVYLSGNLKVYVQVAEKFDASRACHFCDNPNRTACKTFC